MELLKCCVTNQKTLSNGEHPLMLCVCKDNKRKYQSLGISVTTEHWDFKRNQPNDKCPNRERIIILINEKVNEIQRIALDKKIAGRDFSASTLIESAKHSATSKKTVGDYYLTYIDNLKKENRLRYAEWTYLDIAGHRVKNQQIGKIYHLTKWNFICIFVRG